MSEKTNLEVFGNGIEKKELSLRKRDTNSISITDLDIADGKEKVMDAVSLVQWTICGSNTYKPVSSTISKLQSGVYDITISQIHGTIYQKKDVCVDDLLRFPDSLSDKILSEILSFWERGEKFSERGFLHRRGYLFHGPAGSGKTSIVQQIVADIVKADGLVFQCTNHPAIFNEGLSQFRKVEPFRPVVCLFEDIDAIIDENGDDDILALLDGENQIDRVLNIATTNYPEKLDRRLVARPRRFDRVMEIGMPPAIVRKMYFQKKLNVSENELDKWVEASENFSFAACAELVISVCCFEHPFESSVETLREMMDAQLSSNKYKSDTNGVGFASAFKSK